MVAGKRKGTGKKGSANVRGLSTKSLPSAKAKDVRGGLKFTFGTVSVKTVSWSRGDEGPEETPSK